MKKFFLKTYGCQQNLSDSERICTILKNAGFKEAKDMHSADLVIINTCSIRKHAEDRAFGFLYNVDESRATKPKILGVTGCMIRKTSNQNSEKKDKLLSKIKFIDFVLRVEDAINLPKILETLEYEICSSEIGENMGNFFAISPTLQRSFSALVPIMTGCNKFCTYCIVPYARGKEQSRPIGDILEECKKLVTNGAVEITLLGQNVNAYYIDDKDRNTRKNQTDFAHLLNEVAKIKGLKRIRFMSPHPSQMSKDVIDVMASNNNICKHLHLPVQSGSDEILRAMNRSHTRKDFEEIIAYARKKMPNMAISTDIIVGFPGETEDQFNESKNLLEQEKFDMVYIAKFSPRKGTAAAKIDDNISITEKKRRFDMMQNLLREISLEQNQKWADRNVEVLIEEVNDKTATGKTEQSKVVHFPAHNAKIGDIVNVKLNEATMWYLLGEALDNK